MDPDHRVIRRADCIGTVAFTFHKTAATIGLETKPTLAATRNETGRNNYQTLPIVIRTEH